MKLINCVLQIAAMVLIAVPAVAQERLTLESLDQRISRIERVLDQSLLEQLQRVDALQREIRTLRGELESVSYELNTATRRNNDLYADTDRRLTDLETFKETSEFAPADGSEIQGGLQGSLADETVSLLDETSSPANRQPGIVAAPAIIVSKEQPLTAVQNIADFGNGPKPPTTALRENGSNAEKQAYTRAYDLLARGQMPEAMAGFQQFLLEYPDGPYSDKAWYWLGEARYAQQEFDLALRNFGVVINSFPASQKVPDARLKIGFSLYEKQDYTRARDMLTRVQDDYPGRSASVLARKRLQEMDRKGQ